MCNSFMNFGALKQASLRVLTAAILMVGAIVMSITDLAAELVPVDVELVLAVDVSGSVDWQEAELQRAGYVQVIKSPEFVAAVHSGILGKIAVTYIEWAGEGDQTKVIDWQMIKDQASANAFAKTLAKSQIDTGPWTSISDLINYSVPLFSANNYQATRRIIDISGDGPNNSGKLVTLARDAAVRKGITINGLPIINDRLQPSGRKQIANLDKYYAACVIGGPRAFLVVAQSFKDFTRAIRRKMIFEIANIMPQNGLTLENHANQPSYFHRIANLYPPGCDVGERRLQQRGLNGDDEF
jgi:hypothetical protein